MGVQGVKGGCASEGGCVTCTVWLAYESIKPVRAQRSHAPHLRTRQAEQGEGGWWEGRVEEGQIVEGKRRHAIRHGMERGTHCHNVEWSDMTRWVGKQGGAAYTYPFMAPRMSTGRLRSANSRWNCSCAGHRHHTHV